MILFVSDERLNVAAGLQGCWVKEQTQTGYGSRRLSMKCELTGSFETGVTLRSPVIAFASRGDALKLSGGD
jgi:hypothetical protein